MALEIQVADREGVAVVSLKGRLTVAESAGLRERVNQFSAAGQNRVVMDLSELEYIDSTGLGNLVIYYTSLKKNGGGEAREPE
jgi:anti-sigma B factor antagonist